MREKRDDSAWNREGTGFTLLLVGAVGALLALVWLAYAFLEPGPGSFTPKQAGLALLVALLIAAVGAWLVAGGARRRHRRDV